MEITISFFFQPTSFQFPKHICLNSKPDHLVSLSPRDVKLSARMLPINV